MSLLTPSQELLASFQEAQDAYERHMQIEQEIAKNQIVKETIQERWLPLLEDAMEAGSHAEGGSGNRDGHLFRSEWGHLYDSGDSPVDVAIKKHTAGQKPDSPLLHISVWLRLADHEKKVFSDSERVIQIDCTENSWAIKLVDDDQPSGEREIQYQVIRPDTLEWAKMETTLIQLERTEFRVPETS